VIVFFCFSDASHSRVRRHRSAALELVDSGKEPVLRERARDAIFYIRTNNDECGDDVPEPFMNALVDEDRSFGLAHGDSGAPRRV